MSECEWNKQIAELPFYQHAEWNGEQVASRRPSARTSQDWRLQNKANTAQCDRRATRRAQAPRSAAASSAHNSASQWYTDADSRQRKPIYFHGELSPFSNFYPCVDLLAYGERFRSVEHAYQYGQALHYGDRNAAWEIAKACDARAAKRASKSVSRTPKLQAGWKEQRLCLMAFLLEEKVKVCPPLYSALLESGDARLIEDVPSKDAFWGTGFSSQGENHLGRLLEEVRANLIKQSLAGGGMAGGGVTGPGGGVTGAGYSSGGSCVSYPPAAQIHTVNNERNFGNPEPDHWEGDQHVQQDTSWAASVSAIEDTVSGNDVHRPVVAPGPGAISYDTGGLPDIASMSPEPPGPAGPADLTTAPHPNYVSYGCPPSMPCSPSPGVTSCYETRMDGSSADFTHKAANSTHKAVDSTHKAVDSTHKAVDSTHKAVNSTHKPVDSTHKAVDSTRNAVDSTRNAVDSTHKAVNSTHKSKGATRKTEVVERKQNVFSDRAQVMLVTTDEAERSSHDGLFDSVHPVKDVAEAPKFIKTLNQVDAIVFKLLSNPAEKCQQGKNRTKYLDKYKKLIEDTLRLSNVRIGVVLSSNKFPEAKSLRAALRACLDVAVVYCTEDGEMCGGEPSCVTVTQFVTKVRSTHSP